MAPAARTLPASFSNEPHAARLAKRGLLSEPTVPRFTSTDRPAQRVRQRAPHFLRLLGQFPGTRVGGAGDVFLPGRADFVFQAQGEGDAFAWNIHPQHLHLDPGIQTLQHILIADHALHLQLQVGQDALYHGVGFRMHRRVAERVVATRYAQETRGLFEGLRPRRGTCFSASRLRNGPWASRCATIWPASVVCRPETRVSRAAA